MIRNNQIVRRAIRQLCFFDIARAKHVRLISRASIGFFHIRFSSSAKKRFRTKKILFYLKKFGRVELGVPELLTVHLSADCLQKPRVGHVRGEAAPTERPLTRTGFRPCDPEARKSRRRLQIF